MKWLIVGAGTAGLMIAAVVVVGALLPESHVATRSATFDESPEVVWRTITDVEGFPEWRADVRRVEVTRSGSELRGMAWREFGSNGEIPFVVVRAEEPTRLETRIDTDALPFGGSWTYELSSAGGGATRLTLTERGEVYNPVFRFVSRFVIGHSASMDAYLDGLERRLSDQPGP